MALEPIAHLQGRGVVIAGDDIDTDRIIPARFLKVITFDGLGAHLFEDVRIGPDGRSLDHPLDAEAHRGASIILSGRNFGSGSSREHAPQSIKRAGFVAVIAASFAEIFFGNSLTLGLVCIALEREALAALQSAVQAHPAEPLTIDVAEGSVTFLGRTYLGSLPDGARSALLAGRFDPLAELLANDAGIARTASNLPYLQGTDA
jgi:3-isopropylmalate/(R)-2-methylmalate dehydratase small subunit